MTPQVVLIGPPGAGKTSIGRALAKKLHVDFSDTDTLIESDQGRKISEIFIDEGEPYFREVEERICIQALENEGGVLSLGGGAVLTPSVGNSLANCGAQVVFLDVSLAVAAPRIGFNRDRPLLLGNPRAQWQQLLDARRGTYELLATIVIEVGDRKIQEIANEIAEKVLL